MFVYECAVTFNPYANQRVLRVQYASSRENKGRMVVGVIMEGHHTSVGDFVKNLRVFADAIENDVTEAFPNADTR